MVFSETAWINSRMTLPPDQHFLAKEQIILRVQDGRGIEHSINVIQYYMRFYPALTFNQFLAGRPQPLFFGPNNTTAGVGVLTKTDDQQWVIVTFYFSFIRYILYHVNGLREAQIKYLYDQVSKINIISNQCRLKIVSKLQMPCQISTLINPYVKYQLQYLSMKIDSKY